MLDQVNAKPRNVANVWTSVGHPDNLPTANANTIHAWEVTRAVYEGAVMPQSQLDTETISLLRKIKDGCRAWKRTSTQIYPTASDLGVDKKALRKLIKQDLAEDRGFGVQLSIGGMIELDIADGINPWLCGPLKHHRRIVAEAITAGESVPAEVLAEYPDLAATEAAVAANAPF